VFTLNWFSIHFRAIQASAAESICEQGTVMKIRILTTSSLIAISAVAMLAGAARAQVAKDPYLEFEQMEYVPFVASDINGAPREANGPTGGAILQSFQGISQYDVAMFARNFIPPDTMGAVGTTQYLETSNGAVSVYSKAGGAQLSLVSDVAWWAAAGQTGANGDTRVMFDKGQNRWIALSFGNSVSDIQIAVSNTDNALGGWQSVKFTGFAGGTADYPTLALDNNAVYIGTNNFNGGGNFSGTKLNIIPIASLFNAGAPTVAGLAFINTPYPGATDGGFAIQGVNNTDATTTGKVVAASLFTDDVLTYNITNVGTSTQAKTPTVFYGTQDYGDNGAGRQPNQVADTGSTTDFANNDRVIDTLDQRIGSSVYEVNGRIYMVYTATPLGDDFTYVHYVVTDATTNAILDEGNIGDGQHDYYQGSLAVNSKGEVVIGYDRSGSDPADGKITVMARTFYTSTTGKLIQTGSELLLKTSLVDDYHNGSVDGQIALGRQRWGDFSSVSLDPTNDEDFWVIGEYAREYNDAANGHPGGTGGSRWSTWIAEIETSGVVPEPGSWAMMLAGFGVIGGAMRRQRRTVTVTA
jgi:hypothetical protein